MKKPRIIKRADILQSEQAAKMHALGLLAVLVEAFPDDARRFLRRFENRDAHANNFLDTRKSINVE